MAVSCSSAGGVNPSMPIYVDTFPQELRPIRTITINHLLHILPKKVNGLNAWIGGRIARYGKTSEENLIFFIEQETEPTTVQMEFFNEIVLPLKITATVSNDWRDERITALRIYDNGELIRYAYKPVTGHPEITKDYVIDKLLSFPEIDIEGDIYLTGSLVKYGWSKNDVDFIIFTTDHNVISKARFILSGILKCKVHVGNKIMEEREPVYLYKIYSDGLLCQV